MSAQSQELLADYLLALWDGQVFERKDVVQATTELRRLHEVNAELLEACKKALYMLEGRADHQFLLDAIAKAEGGAA